MKNALRNYLKEHDEVVAVYCKIDVGLIMVR